MMKKKIFALVLALVMVLALVPAMAQAGSEQEDVTISKTATAVEGMVNAWDIELTVNAAAKVNPTPGNDVILVLDNSNSMYEGSRMANAKRAAKAFLDQLLPAGNTANRVGVVVFNSEVPSYQPLTADRAALEKFIGGVDQSLNGSPYTRPGYDKGGTFLEVGIEQAAELLRGSGANIKSMVLLSDGAPTYVRVNDKVVGDGTNYDETMYQPTVNAAKKSGAVVYSVALSAGEDGEHVLRGCASDTGKFFAVRNENDVAGLKDVFVTIAGTMTTACKNASVVDEMDRGFVVNGTPTTESGAASVSEDGKTIRLKGKGMPGTGGGEPGDILLKVTIDPDRQYERKGMDLYTTVSIPYTTAVFGGEAKVDTLYGSVVCKIPEGTQSGSKIRLKGKGVPSVKQPSVHGDEYVVIQIQVPKRLRPEAKQKLREYEKLAS